MKSYCSILDEAAAELPDKPLFIFSESRWQREEILTYSDLATRAGAVAQILAETVRPSERALLLFPTGAEFWEAFMGCLASGVIAVPLNMPNLNRTSDQLDKICRDCTPALLMTDENTADLLIRRADRHPYLKQLPVVTPAHWRGQSSEICFQRPTETTTAFLQYTSGSTSRPKGVRISHQNLLTNSEMIRDSMGIRMYDDSGVTWLPHYHDMGLVGSYLQTMFTRNTTVCLAPEEFVLRPARWIRQMSDVRASVCGGPDFAYRLCADKIGEDQLEGIDLSNWRVAYIGAERIRPETMNRFCTKFAATGFRRDAFFPCYGLGEATLIAAGGPADASPVIRQVSTAGLMANRIELPESESDCTELAGSGQTIAGLQVVIVNPLTGSLLPDEFVGEVFLSGSALTEGYFNRPELNESLYRLLEVHGRSVRFLRTGDLGFLSGGQVFITGRTSETIIVRGRNLYPEDIEQQISDAHESLAPGGAVAFAADHKGHESLVIAVELRRSSVPPVSPSAVVSAIRQRVVVGFGVNPVEILLLNPGGVPRTSSGKPRRGALRASYADGTIEHLIREHG